MKPSFRAFFLTAVLLLAAVQGSWAQYITQVKVIGNKNKTDIANLKAQYMNQGWTVIDKDLNEGTKGAIIYMVYKTGSTDGITGFYLRILPPPFPTMAASITARSATAATGSRVPGATSTREPAA